MFADTIRLEGLRLLRTHCVREGIDGCVKCAREQNPWAGEKRTPRPMEILPSCGARAKPAIPELKRIAGCLENDEEDSPRNLSLEKAEVVREIIRAAEASNDLPELNRIETDGD